MRALALPLLVLLLAAPLAPAAEARSNGHRLASGADGLDVEGNATLRLVLHATGGDTVLLVDADGAGLPSSFELSTDNGTATATFASLDADEEPALEPVPPAGWRVLDATCDAGELDAIELHENATTTCTIAIERLALLRVNVSAPGNASFSFAATGAGLPAEVAIVVRNGTGTLLLSDLLPNTTYTLAPLDAAGWTLANATCAGDLVLAPGETRLCSFAFAPRPTFDVVVRTLGGDGTFAFLGDGESLPERFNVTTRNGTGRASFDAEAGGTLSARIVVPDGWELRTGACLDVEVPENGSAECVFRLARLAAIRVTLTALGGDDEFALRLRIDGDLASTIELRTDDGVARHDLTGLDPDDDHALALGVPDGWRISEAPCAQVDLAPGSDVACAFVVTRLGAASGRVTLVSNGTGVAGVVVYADLDEDGRRDAREPDDTTDARGRYTLEPIPLGDAAIRLVVATGWRVVSPADGAREVDLEAGEVLEGQDFRIAAPATPPGEDDDDDQDDDDDDRADERERRLGGGLGYWKNWRNHLTRAEVDALVADAAAASSRLMPPGYAADAAGLDTLLVDALHGCRRDRERGECEALRAAADELVRRLNAAVGHPGRHGGEADEAREDASPRPAKRVAEVDDARLREALAILEEIAGKRLDGKERKALRTFLRE